MELCGGVGEVEREREGEGEKKESIVNYVDGLRAAGSLIYPMIESPILIPCKNHPFA